MAKPADAHDHGHPADGSARPGSDQGTPAVDRRSAADHLRNIERTRPVGVIHGRNRQEHRQRFVGRHQEHGFVAGFKGARLLLQYREKREESARHCITI